MLRRDNFTTDKFQLIITSAIPMAISLLEIPTLHYNATNYLGNYLNGTVTFHAFKWLNVGVNFHLN